jgi:peptidoglycan-associated lipoprotein
MNNPLHRLPGRRRISALLSMAVVATLIGCASKVPLNDPAPISTSGASAAGASASSSGSASAGSASSGAAVSQVSASEAAINSARAALSQVKPSVYFEYDRFEIADNAKPVIDAFVNYLKADTQARVVIEGNADERGTTEYNLALGQKRAEAVSRALTLSGIDSARIEAVSNGEEKPRAEGSNEAAWAENRRADLLIRQ